MKSLFTLNHYFYRYRGRMVVGTLFVCIAVMFSIFPAQFVREAVNTIGDNISQLKATTDVSQHQKYYDSIIWSVAKYSMLVLLMALLRGVFMFMMRQTIIVVSRHIEYDMKNDIYKHYQVLSANFYNVNNTGDLMNRISEDVGRVRMYVGPALMYSINMVINFILITFFMFKIDTTLATYVLLPLPVLVFVIYKVHSVINFKSDLVQSKLSDMSTTVQESFSGIRVLKAFAREYQFSNDFKKQTNEYRELALSLARVNAFFFPSLLLLIGLSSVLTIYVGGLEVINGNLKVGHIAEFVLYVNMLTWPVASLGWVVTLVQRAAASQSRINEFLFTKPEIISTAKNEIAINGNIEFDNVSFLFKHSGVQALKNISFKVDAGKSLAIVGKTGSGKSTIANLLLRVYDVTSGKIKIDGNDIREININSLREQTGYVPQDVFLFSDSISGNISFGLKDHADDATIEQSAKDAAIHSNIMELQHKFETLLGERGINLSGGQKQRVSIARAIIKQPKILIFDDCLSAVDTKTEEEILNNLSRIMKHRTTIIISHRVSSVKNADEIIVLKDGAIIERGNHNSLLEEKGFYFDLYEKQLVEEESPLDLNTDI